MPGAGSTTRSTTSPGRLLVVSHDRVLLDRMDRIAELYRGEIVFYGGNFTAYAEAVEAAQRAAEARRPQRRTAPQAREAADAAGPRTCRPQRRHRRAQRQGRGPAEDRGGQAQARRPGVGRPLRRRARQADRRRQAPTRRGRARAARRRRPRARPTRHRRACRSHGAARAPGSGSARGGRELFADNGIDLDDPRSGTHRADRGQRGGQVDAAADVLSGDRAGRRRRCSGPTGGSPTCRSGWTCSTPTAPSPRVSPRPRPSLSHTRRMHLLAQFLFRGDACRPAGARRCPAGNGCGRRWCACSSPNPRRSCCCSTSRPTTSTWSASAQLESALNAYRGAFVVVSHDETFLDAIGVDRVLRLADSRLAQV